MQLRVKKRAHVICHPTVKACAVLSFGTLGLFEETSVRETLDRRGYAFETARLCSSDQRANQGSQSNPRLLLLPVSVKNKTHPLNRGAAISGFALLI